VTTFLDTSQSLLSKPEFAQHAAHHASTPAVMEAEETASCPQPSREELATGPPKPRHTRRALPPALSKHGTLQPLSKEEPSPPAGGGCPNLSATTSTTARGIDPLSVTYGDAVCAPDLGRAASAAERRLALTTA
jgi:hypothetical protein